MSDAQTTATDTRPWGDRTAASGVEAVFLWAAEEIAKTYDKLSVTAQSLHARIDELEAKALSPVQVAKPMALTPQQQALVDNPRTGAQDAGTAAQEDHHEDQG